jgi:prepilin-type N-terminal cleavage/methylation domain-containing protein
MRRKTGFTLIELLVVVAVIAALVGLFVPAIQSSRDAARLTQCRANLHEIGIAVLHWSDRNRDERMPPSIAAAAQEYESNSAILVCPNDADVIKYGYIPAGRLSYAYNVGGRTRPELLEQYQQPSSRICMASDGTNFHASAGDETAQLGVFLDGHVDFYARTK